MRTIAIVVMGLLVGLGGERVRAEEFDVYFIHLSTGEMWLDSGHGGLRNAVNGSTTAAGHSFVMHDDHSGNADPREWVSRFADYTDWEGYDIVMFKSCFPASHIDSKRLLKQYKRAYKELASRFFSTHPDILFIPVTAPPLVPNETDQTSADRARKFNNWLKRKFVSQYDADSPGLDNVAVFDLFGVLANRTAPSRNMLNKKFRTGAWDSHPNRRGCRKATRKFAPSLEAATDEWAAK